MRRKRCGVEKLEFTSDQFDECRHKLTRIVLLAWRKRLAKVSQYFLNIDELSLHLETTGRISKEIDV